MDSRALYKLSYGLYIVSTSFEGKDAACVVNTIQQVTSDPPQLSVAINKENYTSGSVQKSRLFSGVALTTETDMDLIRRFGFQSSKDVDKFEGVPCRRDDNGLLFVTSHTAARYSCKVVQELDVGSHIIFIGQVQHAEILSDEEPMTYAYYHQVKNGVTPPKASSYQAEEKKGWRCKVCGYVYEGDPLPEGYACPLCGASADQFEPA